MRVGEKSLIGALRDLGPHTSLHKGYRQGKRKHYIFGQRIEKTLHKFKVLIDHQAEATNREGYWFPQVSIGAEEVDGRL